MSDSIKKPQPAQLISQYCTIEDNDEVRKQRRDILKSLRSEDFPSKRELEEITKTLFSSYPEIFSDPKNKTGAIKTEAINCLAAIGEDNKSLLDKIFGPNKNARKKECVEIYDQQYAQKQSRPQSTTNNDLDTSLPSSADSSDASKASTVEAAPSSGNLLSNLFRGVKKTIEKLFSHKEGNDPLKEPLLPNDPLKEPLLPKDPSQGPKKRAFGSFNAPASSDKEQDPINGTSPESLKTKLSQEIEKRKDNEERDKKTVKGAFDQLAQNARDSRDSRLDELTESVEKLITTTKNNKKPPENIALPARKQEKTTNKQNNKSQSSLTKSSKDTENNPQAKTTTQEDTQKNEIVRKGQEKLKEDVRDGQKKLKKEKKKLRSCQYEQKLSEKIYQIFTNSIENPKQQKDGKYTETVSIYDPIQLKEIVSKIEITKDDGISRLRINSQSRLSTTNQGNNKTNGPGLSYQDVTIRYKQANKRCLYQQGKVNELDKKVDDLRLQEFDQENTSPQITPLEVSTKPPTSRVATTSRVGGVKHAQRVKCFELSNAAGRSI